MAGARMKDPQAGYASDFIEVLSPLLKQLCEQKIRVISNAGGVNPQACAAALQAACDKAGSLKIAVLLGDDLQPQFKQLALAASMRCSAARRCRPCASRPTPTLAHRALSKPCAWARTS
jgi:hypothetical protein